MIIGSSLSNSVSAESQDPRPKDVTNSGALDLEDSWLKSSNRKKDIQGTEFYFQFENYFDRDTIYCLFGTQTGQKMRVLSTLAYMGWLNTDNPGLESVSTSINYKFKGSGIDISVPPSVTLSNTENTASVSSTFDDLSESDQNGVWHTVNEMSSKTSCPAYFESIGGVIVTCDYTLNFGNYAETVSFKNKTSPWEG